MELIPHGDLQTCIGRGGRPRLQEYQCQAVASQMCQALKYLHDSNITHRDIKPDNILIFSNDPYIFKLSDFGLSKVVTKEETFLKTFCGTLLYCAPEVYPGYDGLKHGTPRKRRRAKDGRYVPLSRILRGLFGLTSRQLRQARCKSEKTVYFRCRYMGLSSCHLSSALRLATFQCDDDCQLWCADA